MNKEGKLISEPELVSDLFNAHFAGVGDGKSKAVDYNDTGLLRYRSIAKSFFLAPVSKEEITNIINGMQNKSSAGVDEISAKLLKSISEFVVSPLCHLVNTSFLEGKFPTSLKLTMVRPIFKKGNEENCDNYRPISLISTFSKIFEKAVSNRLSNSLKLIIYCFKTSTVSSRTNQQPVLYSVSQIIS